MPLAGQKRMTKLVAEVFFVDQIKLDDFVDFFKCQLQLLSAFLSDAISHSIAALISASAAPF
jgi:hypothetical protein